MKPTIYLTNWGSKRHHGPGRKLTIMALPRAWEHGLGFVRYLQPNVVALRAVKSGDLSIEQYLADYREELAIFPDVLTPGNLMFEVRRDDWAPVADGDTLLCACAVGAPCHRREAAPFLVRAGWRVVLDGQEVIL